MFLLFTQCYTASITLDRYVHRIGLGNYAVCLIAVRPLNLCSKKSFVMPGVMWQFV